MDKQQYHDKALSLLNDRQMAIQKLFSITAKNQLQIVTLLMKGNQRLVLLLFLTYRVLRINLFYNK